MNKKSKIMRGTGEKSKKIVLRTKVARGLHYLRAEKRAGGLSEDFGESKECGV